MKPITNDDEARLAILLHHISRPNISKPTRARLFEKERLRLGMTVKDFAKHVGKPQATMDEILRYKKLTEKEYRDKVESGMTETEIRAELRGQRHRRQDFRAIAQFHTRLNKNREHLRLVDIEALDHLGDLITEIIVEYNKKKREVKDEWGLSA